MQSCNILEPQNCVGAQSHLRVNLALHLLTSALTLLSAVHFFTLTSRNWGQQPLEAAGSGVY